jgi:hypothetical protein
MQVNMWWIFWESYSCKQSKNVASIHMWPYVGFHIVKKNNLVHQIEGVEH